MTRGIVLTCVDPRLHALPDKLAPMIGVDSVFAFRMPGPDGVASSEELSTEWNGFLSGAKRLLGLAPITAIGIAGHTTCAGHNVDDECHCDNTLATAKRFRESGVVSEEIPITAFLAKRGASDEDWDIETLGTF